MAKKVKSVKYGQLLMIERAEELLKEAKAQLRMAECPQSIKKVNSAIKSVQGAARHADAVMHREIYPPIAQRAAFMPVIMQELSA